MEEKGEEWRRIRKWRRMERYIIKVKNETDLGFVAYVFASPFDAYEKLQIIKEKIKEKKEKTAEEYKYSLFSITSAIEIIKDFNGKKIRLDESELEKEIRELSFGLH
ncbi:MAG: hypothetical protein QXS07_02105 [Candidatus Pacearchaeota archaeon]